MEHKMLGDGLPPVTYDAHDEAKAERMCSMGVGCGTAGVCYAEKMGRPEVCARVAHNNFLPKPPVVVPGSYLDKWRKAIVRTDFNVRLHHANSHKPTLLRCLDAKGFTLQSVEPGPQFLGLRIKVVERGWRK